MLAGDTLICLQPPQLKTLNLQLSLLSAYKVGCDSTIVRAQEIINALKDNQADLTRVIANNQLIIQNKNTEIGNLTAIGKKKNKMWLRRVMYGTGGGVVAGLITGIIIMK